MINRFFFKKICLPTLENQDILDKYLFFWLSIKTWKDSSTLSLHFFMAPMSGGCPLPIGTHCLAAALLTDPYCLLDAHCSLPLHPCGWSRHRHLQVPRSYLPAVKHPTCRRGADQCTPLIYFCLRYACEGGSLGKVLSIAHGLIFLLYKLSLFFLLAKGFQG